MPTPKQLLPYLTGATLALTTAALLHTPQVAAAVRAAFVETVLPTTPFHDELQLLGTAAVGTGPDAGTLGITNITLTNQDSAVRQVNIFVATVVGSSCVTGALTGVQPLLQVNLAPLQTLVIPLPSPLVLPANTAHTCVAAALGNGGAVLMFVNGFVD